MVDVLCCTPLIGERSNGLRLARRIMFRFQVGAGAVRPASSPVSSTPRAHGGGTMRGGDNVEVAYRRGDLFEKRHRLMTEIGNVLQHAESV